MVKCQVKACEVSMKEILVTLDNGKENVTYCPNHLVIHAENLFHNEFVTVEASQANNIPTCECCKDKNSIVYEDHEATFYLCEEHLNNLIDLNLQPKDFKTLYKKAGNIYILHDDFYDPETGVAFQPRER